MNTVIKTEKLNIGGSYPCFIIAEIGQNHQGDIEIAKKLINAAKDSGANCVKFQKSCLKEKFTKKCLDRCYDNYNSWGKTYGEHKRHLEFSEVQYEALFKYAKDIDILFTASAMDMVSFDFLLNLGVPFIKIGSGDSNNLVYIEYAASKGIPLVVSTGMVDKSTVNCIYDIISAQHKQFCLLHCVSAYPTPYEDCNLMVLQDYGNNFDVCVGYSGHELGTAVAVAAVALGAKAFSRTHKVTCITYVRVSQRIGVMMNMDETKIMSNDHVTPVPVIEKHITLDKTMKGTDHRCSLTPDELKQLVRDVRIVEASRGSSIKIVLPSRMCF